jgi:hypothetical protein
MNSSMYTVFVARSIVHVKHVGGGGIVGHFIFFGVTYSISEDSNADLRIIFSIFQNWPTIKAVCNKIKKLSWHFFALF